MTTNLVSIGYEGLTIDTLVSRLRIRSVTTLVDVRLNAISRKKGFSKRALTEALKESGIEYVHLPQLGNHRDNRAGYAEVGTSDGIAARDTFSETLTSPAARESLKLLRDLASCGPVAVFCYEADERHCHREQILDHVRSPALV